MATVTLSEGAISAICAAVDGVDSDLKPVLQVTDIQLLKSKNMQRYRLLLSDGVHFQQCMIVTQKNDLINNGGLQKGSIIRLLQFICNTIQNHKIIIIVDLEVLKETCPVVGEPKHYIPPPASVTPSVGQTEMNPLRHGNSHATGPVPTYLASEAGRLLQPKLESSAQMQSYGRHSTVNLGPGFYAVNNGLPVNHESVSSVTVDLSEGAIAAFCSGSGDNIVKPVIQIADISSVNPQNTRSNTERYRLLLSDGVHMQQGMLATVHNGFVSNGQLQKGSVIQLLQFICSKIQSRTVIIVVELEVLQATWPLIGEPKHYFPPGASVLPSVGQAKVNHVHVQHANSQATGPDPTYLASEAGRLLQPKLEPGAQLPKPGPTSREKDLAVRCFKCQGFGHFQSACPNKRTVTLREAVSLRNELYNEACDEEALLLSNGVEEEGSEIVAYEAQSHETSLFLHRTLHTQPEPVMAERDQNFHTKRQVNDRRRSHINLLINGGSCTNVASTELVSNFKSCVRRREAPPKIAPVAALSVGSIAALCSGSGDMKPVVQLVDIRLVRNQNVICGIHRYRLLLSDGVHVQQGMLATQHNGLVRNGHLQKGSLVQIRQFICNKIQSRM